MDKYLEQVQFDARQHNADGVWAVPDELWTIPDNSDSILDNLIDIGLVDVINGKLSYGEPLKQAYPEMFELLTAIDKAEAQRTIDMMVDGGYLAMAFDEQDGIVYVVSEEVTNGTLILD